MMEAIRSAEISFLQEPHAVTPQKTAFFRNAYGLLERKREGKRPSGRPRRRWLDGIQMDIGDIGRGDVDWVDMPQDGDQCRTLVSTVMNTRAPYSTRNVLNSSTIGDHYIRA
jgi:hypothetical protein